MSSRLQTYGNRNIEYISYFWNEKNISDFWNEKTLPIFETKITFLIFETKKKRSTKQNRATLSSHPQAESSQAERYIELKHNNSHDGTLILRDMLPEEWQYFGLCTGYATLSKFCAHFHVFSAFLVDVTTTIIYNVLDVTVTQIPMYGNWAIKKEVSDLRSWKLAVARLRRGRASRTNGFFMAITHPIVIIDRRSAFAVVAASSRRHLG